MKTYEYTYTVKEINLVSANILVEYKTTDENLIPYTLNLPAHLKTEDGGDEFMSVEDLIKSYAPHNQWEAQEYLKEQFDNIMLKTDTVVLDA